MMGEYRFRQCSYGLCPICNVERMLRVAHDVEDGGSFWCPKCSGSWRFGDAKHGHEAHATAAPDGLRVVYEGKLHPDGTVSWYAKGAVLAAPEMQVMSRSQLHLTSRAHDLQTTLRGADRFVFGRDKAGYYVLYQDANRLLTAYRVGKRRIPGPGRRRPADGGRPPPPPCTACSLPLVEGTTAYKPGAPSRGNEGWCSWSKFRFCAVCVTASLQIGPIAGLVSIASAGGPR